MALGDIGDGGAARGEASRMAVLLGEASGYGGAALEVAVMAAAST
jgi:hypothetical protein